MDVGPFQDHLFYVGAIEFSVRTEGQKNLCSIGEELRCPALISLDMGGLMAYHAVIAAAHRSQRKGVGRGPIKNKIHVAIRFEDLANHVGRASGIHIISVGRAASFARLTEGPQRLRAKPGRIVAGKVVTQLHSGGYSPRAWDASSRGPPRLPIPGEQTIHCQDSRVAL